MTMQCKVTKISKTHDDYEILANGNMILRFIFSRGMQFAIRYHHSRNSMLELLVITTTVVRFLL